MATLQAAVRAALEADSTLTAILTGGIFDGTELDRNGLTPETSGLYDTLLQLKPCAVIRWRGSSGSEIIRASERRFFEVYFYQDKAYASIESAKRRVKTLLHRQRVSADNEGVGLLHWINDLGEFVDDELGGATGDRSRYYVDYVRK